MTDTLDIKLTPLDEGDMVSLDMERHGDRDRVVIEVPAGKGLILLWRLRRLFGLDSAPKAEKQPREEGSA